MNGNGKVPQDLEAELALLAAMSLGPETVEKAAQLVGPDDFYGERHGHAFTSIRDRVLEVGDQCGPVELAEILDDVPAVVMALEQLLPTAEYHVDWYAKRIRETAIRRAAILRAHQLDQAARDRNCELDEVERLAGFTPTTSRFAIRVYTMTELEDADLSVDWLIQYVLPASQPCVVGGAKKVLKTSTMADLAVSLATGTAFLGRFGTTSALNVGLLSAESGEHTIRETLRRVAATRGFELRTIRRLFCSFDLPNLDDDHHVLAIRRWIEQCSLRVLILDPAYLLLHVDEEAKNVFAMGAKLRRVSEVVQDLNCTPLIVHHAKKPPAKTYEPMELEDLAFAGFQEFARSWLLIGRRVKYDPARPGEHRLWFTYGGSAGHSGLFGLDVNEGRVEDGRRWDVEVLEAREARDTVADEHDRRRDERRVVRERRLNDERRVKLCRALRENPRGETRSKLREAARVSGTHAGPIEAELVREGMAEVCDVVKANRKKPYEGLRPTPKLLGVQPADTTCDESFRDHPDYSDNQPDYVLSERPPSRSRTHTP